MTATTSSVSPLRQRMLDDMRMRKLSPKTQIGYNLTGPWLLTENVLKLASGNVRFRKFRITSSIIFCT
jgi:hypothetical protein